MKKIEVKHILNILIVLLLFVVGIVFGDIYKSVKERKNSAIYEIMYHDDSIPGKTYNIFVYYDKIEMSQVNHCSVVDCTSRRSEIENLHFSQKNVDKMITFIEDNLYIEKYGFSELYEYNLGDYEIGVLTSLVLDECFFELAYEDYEYKLVYSPTDDIEYNFYFKYDNTIVAKKLTVVEEFEKYKISTYNIRFSDKSMDILYNYLWKNNKDEVYKNGHVYKDEEAIFKSLVENDESYLKDFEKGVKLSYEIYYNGINCPTPILRLYSDNTYEYYDSYEIDGDSVNFKSGVYDYDVSKIINNIYKYRNNKLGPYIIVNGSGRKYTTYSSNVELMEFLNSLGVELNKCLR